MLQVPYIEGFKLKIQIKYHLEKYISTKNNDFVTFYRKCTERFPLEFFARMSICCVIVTVILIRALFNWVSKVIRQLLWFWFWFNFTMGWNWLSIVQLVSNWFAFDFTTLNWTETAFRWLPIYDRTCAEDDSSSNLRQCFPYFTTSTWLQKEKLTVNILAFPSVKFRKVWQTGNKYFTLVGTRFSGKSRRLVQIIST